LTTRAIPCNDLSGLPVPTAETIYHILPTIYSEGRMNDSTLSMIWEALGDERLTTRDASERLENLFGYRCPDDLAKTLSKYRKEGTVKGEISMDLGGWVWWVDDECRSKGGEQ